VERENGRAAGKRRLPVELRLALAVPGPPWVQVPITAGVLLAMNAVYVRAAGTGFEVFDSLGTALTASYLPAALRWWSRIVFRWFQRCGIEDPAVDLDAREAEVLVRDPASLRRARIWGLSGALLAVAAIEVLFTSGDVAWRVWRFGSGDLVNAGLAVLNFWLGARLLFFATVDAGWRVDRPVRERAVDLLDLAPAQETGRLALRFMFLWMVGAAIYMLPSFDAAISPRNLLAFGGAILPIVAVGLLALRASLRAVSATLAAAKSDELERIDRALGGDDAAAAETRIARPGRELAVADLVAWRQRVDEIPSSPIDTAVLRRFLLYSLIPIGSWVASALVERVVDALMGA
jgi:hypothetical protein